MQNLSKEIPILSETNSYDANDFFNDFSGVDITQLLLCVLIFMIGVTGNIWVIFLITWRPHLKTVTNYFIVNLAVADLLVNFICVPLYLEALLHPQWLFGLIVCKGMGYAHGVSVFTSAFFLIAVSIDRCTAISYPKSENSGLSWKQTKIIICIGWVLSLLLASPRLELTKLIEGKVRKQCGQDVGISPYYSEIYFFSDEILYCFVFPLLFIFIKSVIVSRRYSRNDVDQPTANLIPDVLGTSNKYVGLPLAIVTLTFLLSWLPHYLIITIYSLGPSEETIYILETCSSWAILLGYASSIVRPILYAILNEKFSEMSKTLVPSWISFVYRESRQFEVETSVVRTSGV